MKNRILLSVVAGVAALALRANATGLENPSFEDEFGLREDNSMWGRHGVTFGEAYQVYAGTDRHPASARSGARMLMINVYPSSWNGVWQQLPWGENEPYAWRAHFLIQGGDLPDGVSTFMKVEFFDDQNALLAAAEGEHHGRDTQGQWIEDAMRGMTPAGTRSLRFVLIAGDAPDGETYANRIYWDDANIE